VILKIFYQINTAAVILNNTYFNILVSFAYLGKSKSFSESILKLSEQGVANVMIDSGAFTLFNAKKKETWLNLDGYCNFLENHAHRVEKYVMLDVIGNDEASKENYEIMLKRGFNPMFVFTMADNDYSYLKNAVLNNPHLCVAGGVTTKGDWMTKRFQDVYAKTQAKIHGLGYVTYPKIYQLPLHSVDSSSWIQASQVYGILNFFDNGMKGISYKDALTKKKHIPQKLIEVMEKVKISPKEFSNLNCHKGNKSIATLLGILAYIDYQKLSKRKDINLFLAASNELQINQLIYINQEYKNGSLTYEKYRNA